MATSAKSNDNERPPEQVSVEISPAFYEAILRLAEAHGSGISTEELRDILESHLSDTIARTVAEVTGVATPFPQGVDVELQIAAPEDEIEDDDDAIRESIRQGMRDVLRGNVLTEAEFWKAVANDE